MTFFLLSVLDPNTAVRLFANHCLIYRYINTQEGHSQRQKDLDALSLWDKCWGMRFNTRKSHIMHIKNHSGSRYYELTSDMTWASHILTVASKAPQCIGFIRQWGAPYKHNIWGAPYKHRNTAYTSLVRSKLE